MKNKVKIAILDSGINLIHELFRGIEITGGSFDSTGNFQEGSLDDRNGHGTACASVILKECREIELYVYRILDCKSMTSLSVLERALIFLIESDIRIINLSLSIINRTKVNDLKRICERLQSKGKVVVCALGNGCNKSYPAYFKCTLGVQGSILKHSEDYWFCRKKRIQVVIDDEPFLHAGLQQKYSFYGKSNSYASAKMTGYIARILFDTPNIVLSDLYRLLETQAVKQSWSKWDLAKSKRFSIFGSEDETNSPLYREVRKIIGSYLKQSNLSLLDQVSMFDQRLGLTYDNAFDLILEIERKLDIKINNYTDISRENMYSVYRLTKLVQEYI